MIQKNSILIKLIAIFGVVLVLASLWRQSLAPIAAQANPQATLEPVAFLPLIISETNQQPDPQPGECLTAEEAELASLLNTYRNQNGLADVPVTGSLMTVAQWHVMDLHENNPDTGTDLGNGLACNMHSWSNTNPGLWQPVCYTSDHQYAQSMWDKPREISNNVYSDNGYEIAYGSSGQASAAGALSSWQSSSGHNGVILEQGIWAGKKWPAMGIGIYEHHAVVWFGNATDSQGTVTQCP